MLQSTHGLGVRPSRYAVEERLEDAGVELALQVHHVERDVELGRDPPGVVRRIERAAALLELGVGVGHVVEPHPDTDHVVALLVSRIAAATDESTPPDIATRIRLIGNLAGRCRASRADPLIPSGSAATATWPVRERGDDARHDRDAVSISASVVERPSDRRSAPRASSSG